MSKAKESGAVSADKEYMDEYEDYNIEQDKFVGHGGKGRSKKEVEQQHHTAPGGDTRKVVQNMMNNSANHKK